MLLQFRESMPYLLLNDEFLRVDQPVLTAANRSFRYGDGIFETMRMMNGKLQFADFHADRIREGLKVLKMEGGALLDEYFLRQKTSELQKRNRMSGNVRFRLSLYRDGEGLYTPVHNKTAYLMEATPLEGVSYEFNKKGLIIDVFDEIPKSVDKLANLKTNNALCYVMAGLYQQQHRLDEAILLNNKGMLCESTSSNVFVVYQKQIYTPALSEGCVSGVMRKVVLQLAKTHHLPLIEAQISPEILKEAEEVFVTNALSGIRWVMGYGRKRYFNEVAKVLSLKLNEWVNPLI